MRRPLRLPMRFLPLAALALLLLVAAPVSSQTRPAGTAGLTPAEARLSQANYAALEGRYRLRGATLRAIARAVGRRNPRISDARLLEVVTVLAVEAADLRGRVTELEARVARLDDPATRDPALAALRRANLAIDEGRLEDAEAAFRIVRELRWGESEMARAAWREAVEAEAGAARLQREDDRAEAILLAASDQSEAARVRSLLEAWSFDMAAADGRYEQSLNFGDAAALARAIDILRNRALPRVPQAAFPREWSETQNKLGSALNLQGGRLGGAEGATALTQAVSAYQGALSVRTLERFPVDWANINGNLGNVHLERARYVPSAEGAALLEEAEAHFRAALTVLTQTSTPLDWARTQNNLGNTLRERGRRTSGPAGLALLSEAEGRYASTLSVYTPQAAPGSWTSTNDNLGTVRVMLGERTGGEAGVVRFRDAITAYRLALSGLSETDTPASWGTTQSNLGAALVTFGRRLGPDEGAGLQREAADAFRAALRVRSASDMPADWAMTQANLAITLAGIAEHSEREEALVLFADAKIAFEAALTVFTPAEMPVDWAMTQSNFGSALLGRGRLVGGQEGVALLGEAIAAFHAVLRVRQEATMPPQWAMTMTNLALAYEALADLGDEPAVNLRRAERALRDAARVYTAEDMPEYHRIVAESLARIDDKIAALGR